MGHDVGYPVQPPRTDIGGFGARNENIWNDDPVYDESRDDV